MKKRLIALIMFLAPVLTYAQEMTMGSFDALANERYVSVEFDYSRSKIGKVPFDIFLDEEENWDKGYVDIVKRFVREANQNTQDLFYKASETENYKLTFVVLVVDDDGSTNGSLFLKDKDGNTIGVAGPFKAYGGRFGSKMNLMGDASERLGKKVARFIVKALKSKK
jgi:hypothetical protein